MLSRTIRLSVITLATAVTALASASIADAAAVHPNFGGSRTGTTQSTPKMPDVQARQPVIHTNTKMIRCTHTRTIDKVGIILHHTNCGG